MQSLKGTNYFNALSKTHTNLRIKSSQMQVDHGNRYFWTWELWIASRAWVPVEKGELKAKQGQAV